MVNLKYASVPAQYVIVVDGYSSGALLAPAFRSRGYEVLHVQSFPVVPRCYHGTFIAEHYDGNVIYDGDMELLLQTVRSFSPLAVIPGAESGVSLADELSQRLGLLTNGSELSAARRNKFLMGERLKEKNVAAVRQCLAKTKEEAIAFCESLSDWPVVIKPIESAGTDGVSICYSPERVLASVEKTLSTSNVFMNHNGGVVIQEFLRGTEYAVNTVSRSGRHVVSDIWEYTRHIGKDVGTIYDEDWLLPARGEVQDKLTEYAFSVLEALGVQHGPAHLEVKMTDRGPVLVEIGARLCGASLPRMVKQATGQSQVDLTVQSYVEGFQSVSPTYELKQCAAVVFLQGAGRGKMCFRWIPQLRALPAVSRVQMNFAEGAELPQTVDGQSVIGTVELLAEDEQEIKQTVKLIREWEKAGRFEV